MASQSGFIIPRFDSLPPKTWFVGLPVKVNGDLLGLIVMKMTKSSVPFIEYHVFSKQVEFVTEKLAKIINFKIHKTQSIRNAAISEFTAALSKETNITKIMKSTVYYVCAALGIASVIISSYEKKTKFVKTIVSLSSRGREHLNNLIKINNFILLKASTQNEPLLIKNLADSGFLSNDSFVKSVISMRLFSSSNHDYFFSCA
jgi:transcriptional regulator with GAF, ATPase, and Fis domain